MDTAHAERQPPLIGSIGQNEHRYPKEDEALIADAPLAVLLIGITGSGKTTLARALAERGLIRLSVDEEVHRLHGRYGVDYLEHEYFERERPVIDAVQQQLIDHLEAGRSVVLDHGLWLREAATCGRKLSRPRVASGGWCTSPSSRANCCGASLSATSAKTPTR